VDSGHSFSSATLFWPVDSYGTHGRAMEALPTAPPSQPHETVASVQSSVPISVPIWGMSA